MSEIPLQGGEGACDRNASGATRRFRFRGSGLGSRVQASRERVHGRQKYLAHKKQPPLFLLKHSPPPKDHHMNLGVVLMWGPRRGVFLMSEVTL